MQIITAIIYLLGILLLSKNIIHFFQLESYQFPGFFKTIKRNFKHSILPFLLVFLFVTLLYYIRLNSVVSLLLFILLCYFIFIKTNIKSAKKPLIFTGRVKRLILVYTIVLSLSMVVLIKYGACVYGFVFAIPIFIMAALLAWPIEKIISEFYFQDAKSKLNSIPNLIRIGITGSYGKTTVKNILAHILNQYTPTLMSPKSFNTPMGITITIRNMLSEHYRIFLAEMGSRHLGDIKELCRLVSPNIGIISSVGAQHLDTFKSIENVKKGKYELIQCLPKDGHGFFQDDNAIVRELYQQTSIHKTLVSLYDENADVYVNNIIMSAKGSSFNIRFPNQEELSCNTALLGEINIKNIALSAAVAHFLKVPHSIIKKGIQSIQPIKNRLEIIPAGIYTIINDAFNSNPVGSKEAVNVLSKFEGRKIIITPGMVELGSEEAQLNYNFGEHIGKHVDIAILIGNKRIQPIKEGILNAGFASDKLYIVKTLEESTKLLHSIVQKGDIVLYENDLPDNYMDA